MNTVDYVQGGRAPAVMRGKHTYARMIGCLVTRAWLRWGTAFLAIYAYSHNPSVPTSACIHPLTGGIATDAHRASHQGGKGHDGESALGHAGHDVGWVEVIEVRNVGRNSLYLVLSALNKPEPQFLAHNHASAHVLAWEIP